MSNFTQETRQELAKQGLAMPDGGYPIRNRSDLLSAIRAYGRGKNKPEVKEWIQKRAKELHAERYLPENWGVEDDSDSLSHYGIKGMKWGVRRYQNENVTLTAAGKRRSRNAYNKNYTDKQRKQDRAIYGRGAERRINRRMNEGYGVRGARAYEADRKARNDRRKATARRVGKAITGTAVSLGSAYLYDQIFNQGQGTQLVVNFAQRSTSAGMAFVNSVRRNRIRF